MARRTLPGLLPKAPEDVEALLQYAIDPDNLNPEGRATAAAKVVLRLQAWIEQLVAKGNELHMMYSGLTVDDVYGIARQHLALQDDGCECVVIQFVDENDEPVRPVVVRAATEQEVAMVQAAKAARAEQET